MRPSPPIIFFFIFMQFSGEIRQNNRLVPPPLQLAPPAPVWEIVVPPQLKMAALSLAKGNVNLHWNINSRMKSFRFCFRLTVLRIYSLGNFSVFTRCSPPVDNVKLLLIFSWIHIYVTWPQNTLMHNRLAARGVNLDVVLLAKLIEIIDCIFRLLFLQIWRRKHKTKEYA